MIKTEEKSKTVLTPFVVAHAEENGAGKRAGKRTTKEDATKDVLKRVVKRVKKL